MEQNDSRGRPVADAGERWLLLMHQVPAKPDYLRVKVWRRLRRMGAVALKNSVWALPPSGSALEDFQWLLKEIGADGGEALVCEASFLAGLTESQRSALQRLRSDAQRPSVRAAALAAASSPSKLAAASAPYRGLVWVTRAGVYVDRIASAWLIRRRIDPGAAFRFVSELGSAPVAGEVRFDTYEGEFTHQADRCTFEVLAQRFAPEDGTLARLGEIVHDIDLRDGKFGAPEAPGLARLIDGICARASSDTDRIDRGMALLDDLYAGLAQTH